MAERVLVTGATGFVGRQVTGPLRARGFEVHGVSRGSPDLASLSPSPASAGGSGWGGEDKSALLLRTPTPSLPHIAGEGAADAGQGITWHQADLLDEATHRALLRDIRPAVVLHAAWYVEHGMFWTAPENETWRDASLALARHAAESGARRFIGLGTCAEYADRDAEDDQPWPETRRIAPATPYGQAKARLAAALATLPIPTAWARLFLMFGPGEPPARLVPSIVRALAEARPAACASGRPVRDFASTRFLGRALAALAAGDVTGPINIASGEARSIAEVARFLGEAVGRPDLIRLGALPDRPGEVPFMVADVTRMRRDLGFAEPPDVEADLRRMVGATGIEPVTLRV
jgi:nucleoside-diphosphate-sugar epimerase